MKNAINNNLVTFRMGNKQVRLDDYISGIKKQAISLFFFIYFHSDT